MPLVPFSKEVVQDVAILHSQSTDVLSEFCKIALNGVQTGSVSQKMYSKAAESLQLDPESVRKSIEALAAVFLECSKRAVSKEDFELSISELGFKGDSQSILSEAFAANSKSIRTFLSDGSLKLPHYTNLDWRLDVQLHSRSMRQQFTPSILMELETKEPNHDGSDGGESKREVLQIDYANLRHVCAQLEDAVAQLKSGHCRRILRYIR